MYAPEKKCIPQMSHVFHMAKLLYIHQLRKFANIHVKNELPRMNDMIRNAIYRRHGNDAAARLHRMSLQLGQKASIWTLANPTKIM